MPPPADTNSSDEQRAFYQDIAPTIPRCFLGEAENAISPAAAQTAFEQVLQALTVRRTVLDLEFNIRRNRAKALVWESLAEEKLHRLSSGEELSSYHRKRLEGELAEAKVMVEYCQEKIEQWRLEIAAWKATGRDV